jgi:beta-lactamase regulating signal transducer with metallopeptidase domain
MKELAALLGSPLFRRIGWALLAFLWQGTLVAAVLACADVALFRRKAAVRYAVGCGALLLMLAMPVATFLTHRPEVRDARRASTPEVAARPAAPQPSGRVLPVAEGLGAFSAGSLALTIRANAGSLTPIFVAGWLLGVLLLSLRFLAGWTAARSLVRRAVSRAPEAQLGTLARLSERLRVSRPVRLMQSAALSVPTALGAFRPVILLPLCAVTGLSPEAVEALLAHELAHIRRHDYLVNLLQTAVETLLFYHPAVWWVSHRIRVERENCCDDLAVMATGDPRAYARALVGLEEIRGLALDGSGGGPFGPPVPLGVAANGGSLWRRVERLLPVSTAPADGASGWLAGVLALALLGTLGAAARISAFAEASADRSSFASASETTPSPDSAPRAQRAAKTAGRPEPARGPAGKSDARASETRVAGGVAGGIPGGVASGVAGGVAGGVGRGVSGGIGEGASSDAVEDPSGDTGKNQPLSPGDLASLRSRGVTPEFLREISALGYKRASVGDLVALRIHGVTPDYISRMTALVGRQSLDALVSLRIHGVTPEFVERFHAAGYPQISADHLLSLRIHGVDPDTAGEWEKLGFEKPGLDAIVSARIHGVTPDFAREMKALGIEPDLDTLVSLRIHGVTPEFVGAFQALGYKNLSADEAVSCRIHGVTPDFVKEIRSLGYASPSLDELTALRIHGATPEFIRKTNGSAGARLSIDELVEWRIHGRDPR